jgi:UDP-N-acetylglucosamine 4,6-dehydratase
MGTIDGASVLVTGGTGSFGTHFIEYVMETFRPEKIVIFSRGEKAQCEMEDRLAYWKPKLRFILGSVTDAARVSRACQGIDIVVHAAALKVVPKLEYNPLETTDVNVGGTRNVIDACIERKVKKAIFIATDKGVMPVNLYGHTKGLAERLWMESNYLSPIFSVVRYGNVMRSRGGVLSYYLGLKKQGAKDYPLTHLDCTRFWLDYKDAIDLVIRALDEKSGLILASKTKSFRVKDLIKAIYLRADPKVTGLREGEKVHETLVNEYEASRAKELQHFYKIYPSFSFDDAILYNKEEGKDMTKAIVSNDPELLMGLDEMRKKVDEVEAEIKEGK